MKKIGLIGGGLVVIVVVAVVVVYLQLGSIIKTVVEDVGSQATQAKVTLGSADISASSGQGGLHDLVIGNPSGFKAPSAFRLGEISLTVDTATVTSDTIVVKEVVIAGPEITYEIGSAGNNIDAIRANVDAFAKAHGAGTGGAAKQESGGKTVIIDNLYIRGGRVAVSAPFITGDPVGTGLPDIHLTGIGRKEGGASPAEVADQIIEAMAGSATKAVSALNLDKLKDMTKGVTGAVEGVAKGAGGTVEGVGDKVKGLFGK